MNEHDTYYLKRIQNDLRLIWDDTTIEPRTKWQLLDNALTQIILIHEPKLLASIQEYFTLVHYNKEHPENFNICRRYIFYFC